jgi:uncharacterized protein (TIGR02246 family)
MNTTHPTISATKASGTHFLEDIRKIEDVIVAFEQAWNSHQMTALNVLFTDDAEFVNAVGKNLRGRSEIVGTHEFYHMTIFQHVRIDRARLEIRIITSEVAFANLIVKIDDGSSPHSGQSSDPKHRLAFVLVKRRRAWLITGAHHTTAPFD